MSNWHPLWYPPSAEELSVGSKAAAAAAALGGRTDRERNYIDAISAFYRDSETLDHHTRAVAYEKAMERVYQRYPEDREAAIFYALALNATASPIDKSLSNQKKAAQILNEIFTEQPDHPGVAHYLIHSYDSAPLAALGLPAAICYSKIAPSVPHALHCPRISSPDWANGRIRSTQTGNRWPRRKTTRFVTGARASRGTSRSTPWIISNTPICSFGRTMPPTARRRRQRLSRSDAADTPRRLRNGGHFGALRRRAKGLATGGKSFPSPGAMPLVRFSLDKGDDLYARALGAARTGDVAGARAEIERLQSDHDALRRGTNTGPIKLRSSVWRRLPCSLARRARTRKRWPS